MDTIEINYLFWKHGIIDALPIIKEHILRIENSVEEEYYIGKYNICFDKTFDCISITKLNMFLKRLCTKYNWYKIIEDNYLLMINKCFTRTKWRYENKSPIITFGHLTENNKFTVVLSIRGRRGYHYHHVGIFNIDYI